MTVTESGGKTIERLVRNDEERRSEYLEEEADPLMLELADHELHEESGMAAEDCTFCLGS